MSFAAEAAVSKEVTSTLLFKRTQLCPMTSLGIVPAFVNTTLRDSPGLAEIAVMSYFIVSLALMSISRGPDGAGVAAAAVVAGWEDWPQPAPISAIKVRTENVIFFIVDVNSHFADPYATMIDYLRWSLEQGMITRSYIKCVD